MSDAEDHVETMLLKQAAACLAHVRAVRFGCANTHYEITDQDLRLLVRIDISSVGTVTVKT
jgi:hypothetical protein